jgi:SulP family sulfate permease
VILGQAGNVATFLMISVVSLLLNASGLELVVQQDIDLNRELKVAGIGNVLCGLGGGLVGFHLLSESTLSYKMGGRSRLVGLVSVGLCGLVLFGGMSLLYFVPKLILGSLLMLLGLSFLIEWVYQAWFKFSRIDYLIILTILIVIVLVGFLEGVALGIGLTVLFFVFNYSRIDVVKQTFSGATYQSRVTRRRAHRQILRQKGAEIHILQLQGFIFFGTANNLLEQVRRQLQEPNLARVRYLVLDFGQVTGLDSTAALSFTRLIHLARTQQVALVFTNPLIKRDLPDQTRTIAKFFAQLGDAEHGETEKTVHIFPDLDHGLEWCENQILLAAGANPNDQIESLNFLFSSLLPDTPNLDRLLKYFERLDVGAGYYLTRAGDPPGDLYFIESGHVTAQLEFPNRAPIRLETMGGGRVVGEIGFYLNQPRTASAVTDAPSTIHHLSRQTLKQMAQHDPEAASLFHQGIIRLLAERLTHTTNTVHTLQR